ncbi:MAG: tetratricopeptide repeat protein [Parvibaculaceae bacterium]
MTIRFARFLTAFVLASGLLLAAPHAVYASGTNAEMQSASKRLVERAAKTNDQDQSRKLLEQALVANPANADALSGLAKYYVTANKPLVARKYYKFTLFVDPANVSALSGLGLLDLADGKLSAAQEHYDVLNKVCADCSETRALAAKMNTPLKASSTDKP